MVHFADINQAPSPDSMLQDTGRVATPKLVPRNCLRYLQTTLIMGGGGLVSVLYSKLGVLRHFPFFKPHKKQQN